MPEPVPTSSAENFCRRDAAGDRFEKFHAAARGRVGAGAEGHARLDGDHLAAAKLWRRRSTAASPKNCLPTRRGLMKRFQECCQFSCRMIFQRSRGLPGARRQAGDGTDETMDVPAQRRAGKRSGEKRFQAVFLQDDARRAALDQKIRKGIDVCGAGADRKMRPRLRHEFLCHRPKSGSIEGFRPKIIRLAARRLSKSPLPDIENIRAEKEHPMKLATIKPNDLAIVKNDTLIAIGDVLPAGATMIDLIAAYDGIKSRLNDCDRKRRRQKARPETAQSRRWRGRRRSGPRRAITSAAPQGLGDARGRGTASKTSPEELLENIFLEAAFGHRRPGREYSDPEERRFDLSRARALRGHRQARRATSAKSALSM